MRIAALWNESGMTSRIDDEDAAERHEDRSHAERRNEGFPGHEPFTLEIGESIATRC